MVGSAGPALHGRAGILASRIPTPRYLRYCPLCRQDDLDSVGEPYWHRLHQLPGILVCVPHQIPLCESIVSRHHRTHRQDPIVLRRSTEGTEAAIAVPWRSHQVALAQYAAALFRRREPDDDPERWRSNYQQRLIAKGLAWPSGRVRQREFCEAVEAYFGPAFLESLACSIPRTADHWLTHLVRKPTSSSHPLHHLLVWRFLEVPVADLTQMVAVPEPFGPGPWPCLNHAADHYRQRMIRTCQIRYGAGNG